MEVLPLGPVVFIDTPGIDDKGMLGELRIEKTKEILRKTDIGVLVVTRDTYWGEQEESITEQFIKRGVPFVIVINKCEDRMDDNDRGNLPEYPIPPQDVYKRQVHADAKFVDLEGNIDFSQIDFI